MAHQQDIDLPPFIHSSILSWIAFLVMVVYFLRAHLDAPLGSKVVSPRAERGGVVVLVIVSPVVVSVCMCVVLCVC